MNSYNNASAASGTTPEGEQEPAEKPGTVKERWSRAHKLAALGIVVAVLGIGFRIVVPEARKLLHLDKMSSALKTEDTPHVLVAQVAKDAEDLRQQNKVELIQDSESGKTFAEIPKGSFGFVYEGLFIDRPHEQVSVDTRRVSEWFEIHKLNDGSGVIVGYVGPETFERFRAGMPSGAPLTLYSEPWNTAPKIVGIGFSSVKCTRQRAIDMGRFLPTIGVLDCIAK